MFQALWLAMTGCILVIEEPAPDWGRDTDVGSDVVTNDTGSLAPTRSMLVDLVWVCGLAPGYCTMQFELSGSTLTLTAQGDGVDIVNQGELTTAGLDEIDRLVQAVIAEDPPTFSGSGGAVDAPFLTTTIHPAGEPAPTTYVWDYDLPGLPVSDMPASLGAIDALYESFDEALATCTANGWVLPDADCAIVP